MNLGMASCCSTFRFRPQFLSETLGLSPIYLNKSLSCSSFSHTTHYNSSISLNPSINLPNNLVCKAAGYVFPDPIPEFADSETRKFSRDLIDKLTRKKKDLFGDSMEEVVGICTEIMSNFLHTEYGGPGTLLVIPFIDMADTINERGLPGGPQAARAAVLWAQKHVDKDWKAWIKGENNDDSK